MTQEREAPRVIKIIKTKGTHSWVEASVKDLKTGEYRTRIIKKENKYITK